MTTPDFSKIWASESPLTPYTFDDDEYLEGWATIGEIPPDRRQFDTWQRLADTKMLWLKQNILGYLLRQNSTEYLAGDIAFSPSLPSSLLLECTTPGTTAATEPDFSSAVDKGTVTDGTVVWTYRKILSGDGGGGVPLAAIIPWVDDTNPVPEGFLKCDGSAVSRTAYPDLFGAIGTKYGSGDGSTTFNTPDLTDAAIMNGTYDKTAYTTAGSATFTAPKDGYYKITVKGGGGGGGCGKPISSGRHYGGGGGGEGGTTVAYEYITVGATVTVVVGAGGIHSTTSTASGGNGGNSTVSVNSNTYTGGGGEGGASVLNAAMTGTGGSGTIPGAPGSGLQFSGDNDAIFCGSGGGTGGAIGANYIVSNATTPIANSGGGGGGGAAAGGSYVARAASDGAAGFVTFEYIGTASQYLIKYTPTVIDSEVSAATSASQAQAAAQAAESYAGSAGIPVGTLFPYAADTQTPPTGFLFCNGQAVSRTMYADLFSVLGTTWGAGDGSTTFNLPTSEDLVLQGASTTNPVGTYLSAGLPNIEGTYAENTSIGAIQSGGDLSGAFIPGSKSYSSVASGISQNGNNLEFDASQSNAIYGNSTTVQPPAACVKFIIKAYDGVTPTSAGIDLSQYVSDLSNKADRSLSNLNAAGEQKLTDTTESVVYEDGFAIIYPNGGTEASPANVTTSSRYVEANPFPGYIVTCIAEIQFNGQWGAAGKYTDNMDRIGVSANQLDNDTIILQTSISYLTINSRYTLNPFGISNDSVSSAPCRIKVWKIGKVASA